MREKPMNLPPDPGSDAALALGCRCPVMDNAHGRGYLGQPGVFVFSADCPVHCAHVWHPEADAPAGRWLITRREGEAGSNRCYLRICPDGEREWSDGEGRSTVTHHSFAAPTHWRFAYG